MGEKSITVIIPTYKPDQTFRRLLMRIAKQTHPADRILIMNTEKKHWDTSYEGLARHMEVVHLSKAEFDHGGTRDRAARMADTDLIIFMTQDALPQNHNLFAELVDFFTLPDVKVAYARQLPAKDCAIIERYTRSFNYPKESRVKGREDLSTLGIKTYFCSNVCAAYDRQTYLDLGGFVTHTIFNEDMIFAGKLIQSGYQVAYAAEARVIHSHNYSNMQQLRRNFDLAVSQVDHPEVFAGIKAEGEGLRLVTQTAKYLLRIRKPWLIGSLLLKSAAKYKGYWLGKHYQALPDKIIMALTMNRSYWK